MNKRILAIIEKEGYTPSRFADKIGIQRSSISHILSGRNKPSLEVIQKILKTFRNINPEWVLFGEGEVYKSKPSELFNFVNSGNDTNEIKKENLQNDNISNKTNTATTTENNISLENSTLNKQKIILLNPDNTFVEFISLD